MATSLKFAVAVLALGLSAPSLAEESHHPAAGAVQTAQGSPPSRPMQPGMGPGPGMGMGQGRMMDQGMGPGMMGQGMGPGMMGQGMGPGMMGPGGMGGMMPMMGMMGMMQGDRHIDGRIAFLKAELKITEAQEKAWTDFAAALRQAAEKSEHAHMGMRPMSGAAGDLSVTQLLERHESFLAARLEAARIVKTALGPLDGVLSKEQKQTLVELHPMLHGMM